MLIWPRCPGLVRGGVCLRLQVVETLSRGLRGAGHDLCLLHGVGRRHRGLGGMSHQQQRQWRRRSLLLCLHCSLRSACRQGCAGRSCYCAQGSLLTPHAHQTLRQTRSAAGHPLGGLGGRCLGRGRRRPSPRLIIRSLPCWKGRLDLLLQVMLLV